MMYSLGIILIQLHSEGMGIAGENMGSKHSEMKQSKHQVSVHQSIHHLDSLKARFV